MILLDGRVIFTLAMSHILIFQAYYSSMGQLYQKATSLGILKVVKWPLHQCSIAMMLKVVTYSQMRHLILQVQEMHKDITMIVHMAFLKWNTTRKKDLKHPNNKEQKWC